MQRLTEHSLNKNSEIYSHLIQCSYFHYTMDLMTIPNRLSNNLFMLHNIPPHILLRNTKVIDQAYHWKFIVV